MVRFFPQAFAQKFSACWNHLQNSEQLRVAHLEEQTPRRESSRVCENLKRELFGEANEVSQAGKDRYGYLPCSAVISIGLIHE